MLWVGLTGGIGAGKSTASRALVALGAALVDADRVAREVVEPGSPGLASVVEAFGPEVLRPDGALDREALGRVVFGDDGARRRLNGLLHPLIGARTVELAAAAQERGAPVLVHDVPLLVENGLAPGYHLVVVVEAPLAQRLHRLTTLRGLPEDDARARLAAQADDASRREVADVVLVNDGPPEQLQRQLAGLWADRLGPYADAVSSGRAAPRGPVGLSPPDPDWDRQGRRLVARLQALCAGRAVRVEHVGSTAVDGLPAQDVVDLQVEVARRDDAEALAGPLAQGGFPRCEDVVGDPVRPQLDPDPDQYWKRFHRSADPGRAANVHVRVAGSASARAVVELRDLLRADPAARDACARAKQRLAELHPDDVDAYAKAEAPFLLSLLRTGAPGDSKK